MRSMKFLYLLGMTVASAMSAPTGDQLSASGKQLDPVPKTAPNQGLEVDQATKDLTTTNTSDMKAGGATNIDLASKMVSFAVSKMVGAMMPGGIAGSVFGMAVGHAVVQTLVAKDENGVSYLDAARNGMSNLMTSTTKEEEKSATTPYATFAKAAVGAAAVGNAIFAALSVKNENGMSYLEMAKSLLPSSMTTTGANVQAGPNLDIIKTAVSIATAAPGAVGNGAVGTQAAKNDSSVSYFELARRGMGYFMPSSTLAPIGANVQSSPNLDIIKTAGSLTAEPPVGSSATGTQADKNANAVSYFDLARIGMGYFMPSSTSTTTGQGTQAASTPYVDMAKAATAIALGKAVFDVLVAKNENGVSYLDMARNGMTNVMGSNTVTTAENAGKAQSSPYLDMVKSGISSLASMVPNPFNTNASKTEATKTDASNTDASKTEALKIDDKEDDDDDFSIPITSVE